MILILVGAGAELDRMTFGDGEIHRYVAQHLTTPPAEIDPNVEFSGSSLRYGRIGLPTLLWLVSGGSTSLMRYMQPILMALSAGAAAAGMAGLFPRAPRAIAVVPLLVPGFAISITGGFAEAPLLALVLWAIKLALEDRWGWAAALLALALLTKESAIVVVIGLGIWALLQKRPEMIGHLTAALVPVGVWYLFVRDRFGSLPLLDPFLRDTTDAIDVPGVALVRSFADPLSSPAFATSVGHAAIWAVSSSLAGRSLYGLLGAVAGVQLLAAAPGAWVFLGDAVRISVLIQMFAVLAVLAWRRPTWAHSGAILTSVTLPRSIIRNVRTDV